MQISEDAAPPVTAGPTEPSRRRFVGVLAAAATTAIASLAPGRALAQLVPGGAHPEPRPGIDGSKVLTPEQLANAPHLIELFDAVREMPHIADGILCYCGCTHIEGYRSLLTCYEDAGMAQYCDICQGQARLAHGRWKEGQTLDQIRRATDARYGHGGGEHIARATQRAGSPFGRHGRDHA
jgi:hypothetical protein